MSLSRDDLLTATTAWVFGELYQICMPGGHYHSQMTGADGVFDHKKFHAYALNTHNVVYRFLRGMKTLDGTCSDMECHLALKARYVFQHHFEALAKLDEERRVL